jgi:hypothetical protein
MIKLLRRARLYQALTPAERAWLKLVGGVVATAVVSAILAAAQVVSGIPVEKVNWQTVAQVAVGAGSAAVWAALAKFYKAHGDPALPVLPALEASQAPGAFQPPAEGPLPAEP